VAATVAGATVLLHGLFWLAPGDPIDLLPNGPELRPVLEAEWGLDQPVGVRILRTLGAVAQGDLGYSLIVKPGADVANLAAKAWGKTLTLALPALALCVGLALLLAWRQDRPRLARLVMVSSATPGFLLAAALITLLNEGAFAGMEAGHWDRPGWFALPDQPSALRTALAIGVLGLSGGLLSEARTEAAGLLESLRGSAFIEAIAARGGSTLGPLLHNLLPPLLGLLSGRLVLVLGGALIVEKVLFIQGAGTLFWEAAMNRDHPLAIGLGIAAAALVASGQALCSLGRAALDPRLRRSGP